MRPGRRSGITLVVAIFRSYGGVAFGGCRMQPYRRRADAILDAKDLSRAMTYKAAAAGVPVGGGKGVIATSPGEALSVRQRTASLRDFAELLESLGGRYVSGQDAGVGARDVAYMARYTSHVRGLSRRRGGSGDPSPMTALGVELAIRASLQHLDGSGDLRRRSVIVVGLGHVGAKLASRLRRAGAELILSDVDPQKRVLAERLGARWLEPDAALLAPADVLSPCALGGVLTRRVARQIHVRAIAGAANNQLGHDDVADLLHERSILWAPDFIANAGGLINIAAELDGYDPGRARARVHGIASTLTEIFTSAAASGASTLRTARTFVDRKLEQRDAEHLRPENGSSSSPCPTLRARLLLD